MNGNRRRNDRSEKAVHIILTLLGFVFLTLGTVLVNISIRQQVPELSIPWAFSLSLDMLCLVLGIFFYAGIASIRANSGWFLTLFFLNHMLLVNDVIIWLYDGVPAKLTQNMTALYGTGVLDLIALPVFANLTKQLTANVPFGEKMTKNRAAFDRAETVTIIAVILAGLVMLLLTPRYGLLFVVDQNGSSFAGSWLYVFFGLLLAGKLFGAIRIFLAKIGFLKKLPVLVYIVVPVLVSFIGQAWDIVDMDCAINFSVLLMIFGQFFSELGTRNERLKKVLGTYVSIDVVRHLLKDADNRAGTKYTATVLLTDLRGFTSASNRLSTEDTVAILNHWLSEMLDVIREQNGTVTEFLGDGFLAVFGAPTEIPDHADRAVTAALMMQKKSEDVVRWNVERGYPPVRMGIGISSGELLFGSFGTKRTARLMAIGAPVNRAMEAEERTLGGQILMTPETEKMLTAPADTGKAAGIRGMLLYSVTGFGGKKELELKTREEPLIRLKKPVRLRIRRLANKTAVNEEFSGTLTSVSTKKAAILTEKPLYPYEQIRFNMEEGVQETVYARTGGENACSDEASIVDITLCPASLEAFIREVTG